VLDVKMKVSDPEKTERQIKSVTGVIESGIFSRFSVRIERIVIGTQADQPRVLKHP
jgi:ribose 5-phosphate isomerase